MFSEYLSNNNNDIRNVFVLVNDFDDVHRIVDLVVGYYNITDIPQIVDTSIYIKDMGVTRINQMTVPPRVFCRFPSNVAFIPTFWNTLKMYRDNVNVIPVGIIMVDIRDRFGLYDCVTRNYVITTNNDKTYKMVDGEMSLLFSEMYTADDYHIVHDLINSSQSDGDDDGRSHHFTEVIDTVGTATT